MKRIKCSAIASSSKQQCSNNALLGSSYCWVHYQKKSPLIFLIIGGFIGLLLQITYDNVTTSEEEKRLTDLSQKFDGFVKFSKELYPSLEENKAIERFQDEFEKLRSEYLTEKNTIKSLSSSIEVKFSGKWSETPGTIIPVSPGDRNWYLVLISPKNGKEIKFFGTQRHSFEDISPSVSTFKSRQAVRSGNFPIGEQLNALLSYRKLRILIPFVFRQNSIENKEIFLEEVKITLFVNNSVEKEHIYKQRAPFTVPLNENGWAIFDINVENLL